MAGRKRKSNVARVPETGRISRAGQSIGLTNAEVRRVRAWVQDKEIVSKLGLGPDYTSQLWFLSAQRKIEEPAHRAGIRFRELHSNWQRAIGVKQLRGASLEPGLGGSAYDPDTPEGELAAKREQRSVAQWEAAKASLEVDIFRAVFDLIIKDELLEWQREQKARIGLNLLAIQFGYTRAARVS